MYKLLPANASVLKNRSPTAQLGGRAVPVLTGRVKLACEKSTFLLCFVRSIWVCACPGPAAIASRQIIAGAWCRKRVIFFDAVLYAVTAALRADQPPDPSVHSRWSITPYLEV